MVQRKGKTRRAPSPSSTDSSAAAVAEAFVEVLSSKAAHPTIEFRASRHAEFLNCIGVFFEASTTEISKSDKERLIKYISSVIVTHELRGVLTDIRRSFVRCTLKGVREKALELLVQIARDDGIWVRELRVELSPWFEKALEDTSPTSRGLALEGLGLCHDGIKQGRTDARSERIMSTMMDMVRWDPSVRCRKIALQQLPLTPKAVSYFVERLYDVSADVRTHVWRLLRAVPFASIPSTQIRDILVAGLADRDKSIRDEAHVCLYDHWFRDADIVKILDAIGCTEDRAMAEMVVKGWCNYYDKEVQVGFEGVDLAKTTPSQALCLRMAVEQAGPDQIYRLNPPSLVEYAGLLLSLYQNCADPNENDAEARQFVLEQWLKLGVPIIKEGDAVGKERLRDVARELLAMEGVKPPLEVVKMIAMLVSHAISDEVQVINFLLMLFEAVRTNESNTASEDDVVTMILVLLISFLPALSAIPALASTPIYTSVIQRGLWSESADNRNMAVFAMAILGAYDRDVAEDAIDLILDMWKQEEGAGGDVLVKVRCMKALCDLLMVQGPVLSQMDVTPRDDVIQLFINQLDDLPSKIEDERMEITFAQTVVQAVVKMLATHAFSGTFTKAEDDPVARFLPRVVQLLLYPAIQADRVLHETLIAFLNGYSLTHPEEVCNITESVLKGDGESQSLAMTEEGEASWARGVKVLVGLLHPARFAQDRNVDNANVWCVRIANTILNTMTNDHIGEFRKQMTPLSPLLHFLPTRTSRGLKELQDLHARIESSEADVKRLLKSGALRSLMAVATRLATAVNGSRVEEPDVGHQDGSDTKDSDSEGRHTSDVDEVDGMPRSPQVNGRRGLKDVTMTPVDELDSAGEGKENDGLPSDTGGGTDVPSEPFGSLG